MNNETVFTLIGTDEDDNALFYCSYCGNLVPVELDENGNINFSRMDDTCQECNALIRRIEYGA